MLATCYLKCARVLVTLSVCLSLTKNVPYTLDYGFHSSEIYTYYTSGTFSVVLLLLMIIVYLLIFMTSCKGIINRRDHVFTQPYMYR